MWSKRAVTLVADQGFSALASRRGPAYARCHVHQVRAARLFGVSQKQEQASEPVAVGDTSGGALERGRAVCGIFSNDGRGQ